MTRLIWWLCGGGALALLILRYVAIGSRQQETDFEERTAAWGNLPRRYQQTYPGNPWMLKIRRRVPLRKRA